MMCYLTVTEHVSSSSFYAGINRLAVSFKFILGGQSSEQYRLSVLPYLPASLIAFKVTNGFLDLSPKMLTVTWLRFPLFSVILSLFWSRYGCV